MIEVEDRKGEESRREQSRLSSSPDVSELVVDVPHVVLDVDGHAGRLQHLHVELLGEGTDKQGPDGVSRSDLIGHPNLLSLLSILQVQNT